MKKILWISENPEKPSGYGTVTKNLCYVLSNHGYDVSVLAGDWHYNEINYSNTFRILSGGQQLYKENYGGDRFGFYISAIRPDIVFTLFDSFVLTYLFDKSIKGADYYNYLVVDSEIPNETDKRLLGKAITMSYFGQKVLKEVCGRDSEVLYHGVDRTIFRPLSYEEKIEFKKKLRLPEDSFIVGSVNANMRRKRWDLLFEAFKRFWKMTDYDKNVYFYVHSIIRQDFSQGFDLKILERFYGLEGRIIYTPHLNYISYSPSALAKIYNIFDIHASATSGESFGLSHLESMSCGIPNVVTNCTSVAELVKGRGELARVKQKVFWDYNQVKYMVDTVDLAAKMYKLYSDESLRKEYSKEAIAFARKYTWDEVARRLDKIFRS